MRSSDSRRHSTALHQSSLTQVLFPENGALSMQNMQGVVYIWGSDNCGQLGLALSQDLDLGEQMQIPFPRMLTTLKNQVITELISGPEHCIAVTINGNCFGWGNNESNQLGLGEESPSIVPIPMMIHTVENIKTGSCGYSHSILLSHNHKVFAMGQGESILGLGRITSALYPREIEKLKRYQVTSVACGGFHTLAVTQDGKVFVWGRGDGGQLGLEHALLQQYMREQKVHADLYQLHTPQKIYSLSELKIIQAACGEAHSLILTEEGRVFGWGWNSNGQLGLGIINADFEAGIGNAMTQRFTPTLLETIQDKVIKHVAAGALFSSFVTDANEVLVCGNNDFGQLGFLPRHKDNNEHGAPIPIEGLSNLEFDKISCGENHSIALSSSHDMVWTWGRYREGQLGLGDHMAGPSPVQPLNGTFIKQANTGNMHSMVLLGNAGHRPIKRKSSKSEMDIQWGVIYRQQK